MTEWPQSIRIIMDSGKEYTAVMEVTKFLNLIASSNKGNFVQIGGGVHISPEHVSSIEL